MPSIVANACDRWECTPDGDPWHGQVALVVPVRHASGLAALKVSFPDPGNHGEADALRCYDAHGAVRLIDADDSHFLLLMEPAEPMTLADHLTNSSDLWVEEAIELAGDLAGRLAVPTPPDTLSLAGTTDGWEGQLNDQVAAVPCVLPEAVIDQARQTIHHLANDTTSTMLHGDLHIANILRSRREPWLAIDQKGWSGTAAWDAFTVIAGRRKELHQDGDLHRGIVDRVQRFSAAARVDADLALTCCQARAVSSYLYQHVIAGAWFDLEFLRVLAHGARRP